MQPSAQPCFVFEMQIELRGPVNEICNSYVNNLHPATLS